MANLGMITDIVNTVPVSHEADSVDENEVEVKKASELIDSNS